MVCRAFLVGINQYSAAPLRGCVNDVVDVANLLVEKFNFKREEIRLLVDQRATTQEILFRLNWLVNNTKPGDKLLYHFSGHGVQVATRNKEEEIDGLLEANCPVDFDWTVQKMITDKQYVSIFKRIPPGAIFNWISDSCHSGDLSREMPFPGRIPRYMPPPEDILWRNEAAHSCDIKPRGMTNGILDVGFVSGSASHQTASDAQFQSRSNGALTYYLIKELREAPSNVPLSVLIESVTKNLASNGFAQRPQAEGARIHLPFLS